MRHLLAATDLSAPSDLALARAIGLARHTGARLTIATVEPAHDLAHLAAEPNPVALGEFERTLADFTARELAARVERARAAGVDATSVFRHGRPGDTLRDLAEELDVDLIVVGSAGHTGLKRLVLGSVAEQIAHSAQRPVLIVRGTGAEDATAGFAKILVATDFAAPAQQALATAQALAAPAAAVQAVYAWHYPAGSLGLAALGERTHATAALREALTQGPQTRGAQLVAAEAAAGRTITFELRHGDAADVIVDAATDGGFDLIATGTGGGGGVRRLLLGSVATRIIRHAPCSVLVTHG
ncbi:MAG: universal stress protein [Kofleriaceae bacterium]